jgi:hypothetical protein
MASVTRSNCTNDKRAVRLKRARAAAQFILLSWTFIAYAVWLTARVGADEPRETTNAEDSAAASNQPKTPTPEVIRQWIAELSHDAYSVRQRAAERLLTAGMTAREPLLELADGTDPETRAAARRLVALIDRSEFHRRLEAFAADTDGRQGQTLPGWEQFRNLVGSEPADRALFVEMQRQEGPLLAAVFGLSKRAPEELWEARLQRISLWQATVNDRGASPPLGSCAAMLFLGSLREMNVSDASVGSLEMLIQRPQMRELLQLVVGWVLNCPNKSDNALRCRLNLIAAAALDEALPLPLSIIARAPGSSRAAPLMTAQAALVIGQLGNRTHIDQLEPLLDDASVCLQGQVLRPGQPQSPVQVRDVALVVLLHLTEQSPAEYGYVTARLQQPRTFDLQSLYRNNDQQRTAAIAKWRAWRASHKEGASPKTSGKDAKATTK